MKLPNGYGSVTKLSGKRRKPYMIRKTLGYTPEGKEIRQVIGYTATKQEALTLLAEYNKKPWDIDQSKMTFTDVYNLWLERGANDLAPNTVRSYQSKYKNYCQDLYDIPYKDIRAYHFENVIEGCGKSNGTKNTIRKLFRQLDRTALANDIITTQYSELLKSKTEEEAHREPFTEKEIKTLWEHVNDKDVDLVLILIYTGFRREEFINITKESIDFENWIITGGSKTKAGKNRKVPVHPRIRPLILNRIENSPDGKLFSYSGNAFSERFKWCLHSLGMKHIPHECRHTLRTRLDNAGANKIVIDLILGHRSSGTGERTYTHKTIDQLHEAINLLD